MGYGPAVLSGLLSGLSGLPAGMNAATDEELARQRLGLEQQRIQNEQDAQSVDLNTYGPALKAAGLDLGPYLPSGRIPNHVAQILVGAAQKNAERERQTQIGQDLSKKLLEQGTSIGVGMKPDTSLSVAQPGLGQLGPTAAAPMAAIAQPQTRVDPNMAKLAQLLPGLLELDKPAAAALLKETFTPEKWQPVTWDTRGFQRGDEFRPAPALPPPPAGMVPSDFKQGPFTYTQPTKGMNESDALAYWQSQARQNPGDPAIAEKARQAKEAYDLAINKTVLGRASTNVSVDARKMPDTTQQTQSIGLQTAVSNVRDLAKMARQLTPGIAQHLFQTAGPTLEDWTHWDTLSPFEREYLTLFHMTKATYLKEMENSTMGRDPETRKSIVAAFGDPWSPRFADSMDMLTRMGLRQLQTQQTVMGQSGKVPIGPGTPGGPASIETPPPPSQEKPQWRKKAEEVLSNSPLNPKNLVTDPNKLNAPKQQFVEGKLYRGSDGNTYKFQNGQMVRQ